MLSSPTLRLAIPFCVFALFAACSNQGGTTDPDTTGVGDTGSDVSDDTESDVAPGSTEPDTDGDSDSDTGPTDIDGCPDDLMGTECGFCGGVWVCEADTAICDDPPRNECGGCGELDHEVGEACDDDGVSGQWECASEEGELVCREQGTGLNPCGGTVVLPGLPGRRCGDDCADGRWECVFADEMVCVGESQRNDCGGCDETPGDEGGSCGVCGDGVLACDGTDMICVGASDAEPNACGGCADLDGVPGDPCEDDCGSGVWTCSQDRERVFCGGEEARNGCGGCGPLVSGEEPGLPCSSCGQWVCDPERDDRTVCSNPFGFNACGTCAELAGLPGTECGCGGTWDCDLQMGNVECIGSLPPNDCGGCSQLADVPGGACGEFGCGEIICVTEDSVTCDDGPINSCGSCLPEVDGFDLGAGCGCGGEWGCSMGQPTCFNAFANACGGCEETLANPPGTPCGAGNCGRYVCDGENSTVCQPGEFNVCGGCLELVEPERVGEACGTCGTWECGGPNRIVCRETELNACGTCGPLTAEPFQPCGDCGVWRCDDTGQDVFCDEAGQNECGFCGDLGVELGSSCGACEGNVWECAPPSAPGLSGDVRCGGPPLNDCGGCIAPETGQARGAHCGDCGRWDCEPGGESDYVCVEEPLDACGQCTNSLLVPGDTCTICGVTGEVECDDDGPICNAEAETNACGGCGPLDGDPGEPCQTCGVWLCNANNEIRCVEGTCP